MSDIRAGKTQKQKEELDMHAHEQEPRLTNNRPGVGSRPSTEPCTKTIRNGQGITCHRQSTRISPVRRGWAETRGRGGRDGGWLQTYRDRHVVLAHERL